MRNFLKFIPFALVLCTSAVSGKSDQHPVPSISAQQAESLINVLRRGSVSSDQLALLPELDGGAIEHLTGLTGIHCIYPNHDEDYFALNAMVGRQLYLFRFTVAPKLSPNPAPQELRALLEGKTITQFYVKFVARNNPGSANLVDYRSRGNTRICDL